MMRQVIGRTPIQPALTEARARIEQDVMTGTQAILDQYGTGVEITQVQLQKVDPPPAVIESFRDVQRANTDAERARNEAESYRNDIVPRARGDAARITAEAEGAKQATRGRGLRPGAALPQRLCGLFGRQGRDPAAALHRDHAGNPEQDALDRRGRPAQGHRALPAAAGDDGDRGRGAAARRRASGAAP